VEQSANVLSEQIAEAESLGSPDASLWQAALRIVQWLGTAGLFMPETAPAPQ